MNRDEMQEILYYAREIQNILYAVQECERLSCKSCNYNAICAVLESLIKLLYYKVSDYDTKGEMKP